MVSLTQPRVSIYDDEGNFIEERAITRANWENGELIYIWATYEEFRVTPNGELWNKYRFNQAKIHTK